MSTTDPSILHRFDKNSTEQVRASVTTFKGRQYLDLRVWAQKDDGSYVATPKGITLNPALADDLLDAVNALANAASKLENGG